MYTSLILKLLVENKSKCIVVSKHIENTAKNAAKSMKIVVKN